MIPTSSLKYQKIFKDRIDIAYVEEGSGAETIIFVHGLALTHLAWQLNINYLKDHCRCIAIDLPGNGKSTSGDFPYSMDFFAESIREFMEKKGIEKAYLAGHSMGGQVAMTLMLKHPGYVKGLLLCAPAGFESFNDWEKNLYRNTMYFVDLVSNEEQSLRKSIQNSFYVLPEEAHALAQRFVDNLRDQDREQYRRMITLCISGMLDAPVIHRLHEISVRTLILFGEKDALIPNRFIHPVSTRQLAEAAAARFPDAQLEMIPRCGHFLQWEKARIVNSLIRHFVVSR